MVRHRKKNRERKVSSVLGCIPMMNIRNSMAKPNTRKGRTKSAFEIFILRNFKKNKYTGFLQGIFGVLRLYIQWFSPSVLKQIIALDGILIH